MTRQDCSEVPNDPEGSIFLPKTQHPEQEFQRWYFELLMGRGIGRDKDAAEILQLNAELQEVKARYFGSVALK